MNVKFCSAAVVSILAGFALGYLSKGKSAAPASEAPAPAAPEIADAGAAASEKALSARIRELEKIFKATDVPEKPVTVDEESYWSEPVVSTDSDGNKTVGVLFIDRGPNLKAMYEKMREENPRLFEERTSFMKEMADRRANDYDERIRYFARIDDSWMDEDTREDYREIIDRMKEFSDANRREGIWDIEQPERDRVTRLMFKAPMVTSQQYPKLREMFLKRAMDVIGLEDADAAEFLGKIREADRFASRAAPFSF